MKNKQVTFTDDQFDRIKAEQKQSGISANSIIVIAVDEYLKKKEKERK